MKVGSRIGDNFEVAAEGDETGDDNNKEGDDFGDTEDVRKAERDVGAEENGCNMRTKKS